LRHSWWLIFCPYTLRRKHSLYYFVYQLRIREQHDENAAQVFRAYQPRVETYRIVESWVKPSFILKQLNFKTYEYQYEIHCVNECFSTCLQLKFTSISNSHSGLYSKMIKKLKNCFFLFLVLIALIWYDFLSMWSMSSQLTNS